MVSHDSCYEEMGKRLDAWFAAHRRLLDAHDFRGAFTADDPPYPRPAFEESPWAPLARPLSESRIACLTTGGLSLAGEQEPFITTPEYGDYTLRRLPRDFEPARVRLDHTHYPHENAEADLNCIFPLERLGELESAGEIGSLAPTHYSIMGYQPLWTRLYNEIVPGVVEGMRAEGVEAACSAPFDPSAISPWD